MIVIILVIIAIVALVRPHPVSYAFALMCLSRKVFYEKYATEEFITKLTAPLAQYTSFFDVYVCSDLADVFYYVSSGAFDVLLIAIIAVYVKPSRMAWSFIVLSIASCLVNFYGLVTWAFNLYPETYNAMFIVLFSIAIFLILRKDTAKDERSYRFDTWNSLFPSPRCKSFFIRGSLQSEREEGRN